MTSISVIVSAYNEEQNINATINNVEAALYEAGVLDTEILFFDDGSNDKTFSSVYGAWHQGHAPVWLLRNPRNMGFGYNFFEGVRLAAKDYVCIFPGDNETSQQTMIGLFKNAGKADIITTYTINMEDRPWGRRLLSRIFTLGMNTLFGCELQYYNGPFLVRREIMKEVTLKTSGFTFGLLTLVQLIRKGYSFKEIPMVLQKKPEYKSSALKFKNVCKVLWSVFLLLNLYLPSQPIKRVI